MKFGVKAWILIGLSLFLLSRVLMGNLFFYINQRFFLLTVFAIIGLLILGFSYRFRTDLDEHQPQHDHGTGHAHGASLSWTGLILIASPMVLGLLIPPRPLGAAAMTNRDISLESLTSAAAPESEQILSKPKAERNILDWVLEFRSVSDRSSLAGEAVKVSGFVYRDERFGQDEFMVSRFVLSCCAADAAPLGMVVHWPDSPQLEADQWVEVSGIFEPGEFSGEPMPLILADTVTPIEIPSQPYLYPF
ncbi:MAG TPA: TIGR03943 family protein [Anaerolineae bacterium]|nr:TIGR03943 family protein [Anaerolineae bacterium]HMR67619.1 TIGR03943 family protein [Anaerolineae bacterium]